MVDWPGLLKWTMTNADGTFDTNIKPLDEDTRKWLAEALEAYTFDEIKRTKELMEKLATLENPDDKDDEVNRTRWLEELLDLVEGLENARDLVRMGLYPILINTMINSQYEEVRKVAYQVFMSSNSNNTFVQEASVKCGSFRLLNSIIHEESLSSKEAALSALTSFVRGESFDIKRLFIDIEGIQFLEMIIKEKEKFKSNKMRTKTILLLNDLVHHDHMLDHQDIIEFNLANGGKAENTSGPSLNKKKEKEEKKEKNELPKAAKELSAYKDFVKKQLINDNFITYGIDVLDESNIKQQIDYRPTLFSVIINLIKFDNKAALSKDQLERIKNLRKILVDENKKTDNLYEGEVFVIDNLISLH